MSNTKIVASAVMFAVVSSFPAQAAAADGIGPGWYLGADLGRAEIEPHNRAFISRTDFSDVAWGAHGGYRISPYFGFFT
jgi:hypothetical protein